MKYITKISLCALLAACILTPSVKTAATVPAQAATYSKNYLGTKTGYTKASDVDYVKSGSYVANWGAREEDCTFLSTYAQSFYTGSYVYDTLSNVSGGTTFSNTSSSQLYKNLQTLMKSNHKKITGYDETKNLYKYTDCVNGDYSRLSSFYGAYNLPSGWGSGGDPWNREHTWPNSKGDASGSGENDIMMLRPAYSKTNSSRGNDAYGESSGYYDPNQDGRSLHGDCARIILYQYVRWNCTTARPKNTKDIFGKSGVIESLDLLLDWIEEDPVDTWEMGRNDAVQSITGTRNVFVDYPEYAWLLFGEDVPSNMVTPSGKAKNVTDTPTPDTPNPDTPNPDTPNPDTPNPDTPNPDTPNPDTPNPDTPNPETPNPETPNPETPSVCQHDFRNWVVTKLPTADEDGEQQRICTLCKEKETQVIPKTSETEINPETLMSCSSSLDGGITAGVLISSLGAFLLRKQKAKKK